MKIFYIASIILITSIQAKSQTRSSSTQDPAARITRFYPNPAVSQITFDIEQSTDKNYSFQIFNFVGKKVFELTTLNAKTVVNVTDFYRGVYIFQLKDKTGKTIDSGKFQVAR
ncbi:MAG: T9SS type A sorting domain-containing protein [Gemmatimonadaceae bacterium]|nr:T9SS type A sorting domain-containing protein [Chitinophagaceae bacterium]